MHSQDVKLYNDEPYVRDIKNIKSLRYSNLIQHWKVEGKIEQEIMMEINKRYITYNSICMLREWETGRKCRKVKENERKNITMNYYISLTCERSYFKYI